MPQYARPISDLIIGDWTPEPLHDRVGGVIPDDLSSIGASGEAPAIIVLSGVTTPGAGDATLRVRARHGSQSAHIGLRAALLDGDTLISEQSLSLSDAIMTIAFTVNRAAITDWANLRVRLTAVDTLGVPENVVMAGAEPVMAGTEYVVYG